MAYIKPCRTCPLREGCAEREEWKAKARGLGFTQVSIRCPKLLAAIRPGRRIAVRAPVYSSGEYGEDDWCRREVKATITSASMSGFSCIIDPGQITSDDLISENADAESVRFWRTKPLSRIHALLDEPDAEMCENGNPQIGEECQSKEGCACEFMRTVGQPEWPL